MRDVVHQPPADRTVGLNCAGGMIELEAQFSAAGFHVVAVQEGRMPSRTLLSRNTYRMHVLEGMGTNHSLGHQMWVDKSLTVVPGPITVVSLCVMCLNLKVRDKCDTIRITLVVFLWVCHPLFPSCARSATSAGGIQQPCLKSS